MILMVSVQNLPESIEALEGGADIVDVKNLQEALVGSAHPHVVRDVREAIPLARSVLGDAPEQKQVYYYLYRCYSILGETEASQEALQKYEAD